MQGLGSLECLSVSDSINVLREDLYALCNLLYQSLPNLKEFYISYISTVDHLLHTAEGRKI